MAQAQTTPASIADIEVPLELSCFCRTLIRELSGLLQDVIGLEEAEGFISIVGQNIGQQINSDYKHALRVETLNAEQIVQVLRDLKQRIHGDFYVIEADENKVVFGNRVCPFAEKVIDRPSLCMMTSNVFGTIAAENAGYAKVELKETIAQGDAGCKVVVYLQDNDEAQAAEGREYFQTGHQ